MGTRIKIKHPIDTEDAINIFNLTKEDWSYVFEAKCDIPKHKRLSDKYWRPYYEVTDLQLELLKRAKISVIYY